LAEQVPVTELNRRSGDLVARVAAGETIELTKRGQVVAVLAPPSKTPKAAKALNPPDARLRPKATGDEITITSDEVDDWGMPADSGPMVHNVLTKQATLEPKLTPDGETQQERRERMDRMRDEVGIKERPSPWQLKNGAKKK